MNDGVVLVFVLVYGTVGMGVALAALYALAKWSISYGRFEMDLTSKAFNLRRAIDDAVDERLKSVNVVAPVKPARPGPQPGDPNVRTSHIVDDVAEMEREMNRVTNADNEYEKRDRAFRQQPEAVEL